MPTPRKSDGRARNAYLREDYHGNLEEWIGKNGDIGPVNPLWVEWLMGFPCGWTDLKPLETLSSPRLSSG